MSVGEISERKERRRVRAENKKRREKAEAESAAKERLAKTQAEATASGNGDKNGEGKEEAERSQIEEARAARMDTTFVRAHMVQVDIHFNHQNGRDSHVRQVQVFGPTQQVSGVGSSFTSTSFQRHETIR
jgi:hypothetical protein